MSTTKQSKSGHVISISSDGVKAINRPDDEVKKNDIKKQKRKLRSVMKALILNSSWAYVRSSKNTPSLVRFCMLFGFTSPFRAYLRIFEWPLLEITD